MKPIKLTIEGLHSFVEKQTIDFSELSANGLFGIFGQTGSGKSTILDAIILALYGKVLRSKTNADFVNLKCKKTEVVFEFSAVSQGKEKTYRIVRTFKRKNKNANEVDQSASISELGAFGSKELMEGASKVDNMIKDIIGLGEEEFLKCIALPQGEFAGFLKAKPNERVSIIGNIFDLNKYGQELWEKVRNRVEQSEKDLAVVSGKLAVLGEVDKDKLIEDSKALEEKKKILKQKRGELENLSKIEKEEREVVQLGSELEKIEERIAACEEVASNISLKKASVVKAKKIYDNKFLFERTNELSSIILEEKNEIYKLKERVVAEEGRYNDFMSAGTIELENYKKNLESSVAKLNQLEMLREEEQELAKTEKSIANNNRESALVSINIDSLDKKLTQKRVDKSLQEDALNKIEEEIESLKNSLKNYEDALAYQSNFKFIAELKTYQDYLDSKNGEAILALTAAVDNIDDLQKKRELANEEYKKLLAEYSLKPSTTGQPKLLKVIDKRNKAYQEFVAIKERLIIFEKEKLESVKQSEKALKEKAKLEQEKAELDEKYEQLTHDLEGLIGEKNLLITQKNEGLSVNGLASVIENVHIGDTCPICSNEIIRKNNVVSIDTISVDNDIEVIDKHISICNDKKESLLYKIAKVVASIALIENKIQELNQKAEKNEKSIQSLWGSLGIDYKGDNLGSIEEFDNMLQSKIKEARVAYERELKYLSSINGHVQNILKQRCVVASSEIEKESYSNLSQTIANSIKEKDLMCLSILSAGEDIAEKIAMLDSVNDSLELRLSERRVVQEAVDAVNRDISMLEKELAGLLERKRNLDSELSTLEGNKVKLMSKLDGVVVGSVDASTDVLKTEIANLRAQISHHEAIVEERQKELANLKSELNGKLIGNKTHEDEHKTLAENLQVLLKLLELQSVEEARYYMMGKEEIEALESTVLNYESEYNHCIKRRDELTERLAGRVSGEDIHNQLILQIEVLQNEIEVMAIEESNLELDINTRSDKLATILKLTKELDDLNKKAAIAKDLYETLRGKALLEYIAEEFIDDIAYMASEKLQLLMDGRYVLKYDNKEFYVIDNFSDGAVRTVSTLSGGEMFVVSLALALSISEAITSRSNKSIDFFFLDEGFGTLDKEYCEYVVQSLIKLVNSNLTIGLISHIPELQERVPNKIYITKTESGSKIKSMIEI